MTDWDQLTPKEQMRAARDIGLLQWDALRAHHVMKRTPDPSVRDASGTAEDVFGRLEPELAGEARRYRGVLIAGALTLLMPGLFAILAWRAMYWLPVSIMWLPFERGGMGLPLLSLYEWVSYLVLGAFLVYGGWQISEGHAATRRLSADYHRLAQAESEQRQAYAEKVSTGRYPRSFAVISRSPAFDSYRSLVSNGEPPDLRGAGAHGRGEETAPSSDSEGERSNALTGLTGMEWPTSTAISVVVVAVALTLMAGWGIGVARRASLAPGWESVAIGAALLAAYAGQFGAVWGLARVAGHRLSAAVGMRRMRLPWLLVAFGVAVIARVATGVWALLLQAAGARAPGPGLDVTRLIPQGAAGVFLTVILVAVVAPLVEESVFRGLVFPSFSARYGSGWGTFVSAGLFALLHPDLYASVPIFVFALMLAELFRRSRSLWVPIFAHAAFNAIGLVGIYALKAWAA